MEWTEFRGYQRSVREEGRFPAYCQQLQNRLGKHDFRRPTQLNEDLHRQNKLATWVEFLNYEYSKHDSMANIGSRLKRQHDEAWNILVDSNVLKPSETEKSLWGLPFGIQLEKEELDAKMAVEYAASVVMSTEKSSEWAPPQMKERLSAAKLKLDTAIHSLENIRKRRNLIVDFHCQTKSYNIAETYANNQLILLRWILQQVPLIESELIPKVSSGEVSTKSSPKQRSKRLNDDSNLGAAKRRKGGEGATTTHSNIPASTDHGPGASKLTSDREKSGEVPDDRVYNPLPRRSSRFRCPPKRFQ